MWAPRYGRPRRRAGVPHRSRPICSPRPRSGDQLRCPPRTGRALNTRHPCVDPAVGSDGEGVRRLSTCEGRCRGLRRRHARKGRPAGPRCPEASCSASRSASERMPALGRPGSRLVQGHITPVRGPRFHPSVNGIAAKPPRRRCPNCRPRAKSHTQYEQDRTSP